jgi:1-acyl-sn-glycerol-3-phosphate acyltransferase
MNLQPYKTPPRWWSPCLNSAWVSFWRPFRRQRAFREHGLAGIEVRGSEHIRQAILAGQGILIAPNHPSHADPFALLEVSDQMQVPFHFMAAWQVFANTHWIGRRVLRQHGCFSVNREGHDLRAYRQAVSLLSESRPLVIFPEGEVFHLNDRVMHFRRGAATAALRAARRTGRPVACVPCGIKYHYSGDPLPPLLAAMSRLEVRVGLAPRVELPLVHRIQRLATVLLKVKEREYFGRAGVGSTQERTQDLMAMLLVRLEDRYAVKAPKQSIPERVKELRRRAIARKEARNARVDSLESQQDLDDLFFVMQLFSYPPDYLNDDPSLERLSETVDKLEEDILGVHRASVRTARRATISYGAPLLALPDASPQAAAELTEGLQARVQTLLDQMSMRPEANSDAATSPTAPWNPAPVAA